MEHRCGHRRNVHVEVRVSTRAGLSGHGFLTEASGSGARLVTHLRLPLHSIVILTCDEIKTPDSKRLRLEAEIIRDTVDGYGIEWTQFAPGGLRMIFQHRASEVERGGGTRAQEPVGSSDWRSSARG